MSPWVLFSDGSVSVVEVGIGFSVFLKVSSVFGIGISKYRDIDIGIRYFSTFPLTCNELCLCHSSHFADSLLSFLVSATLQRRSDQYIAL